MSFAQVLQPAIDLAENGFVLYPTLQTRLAEYADSLGELYPTTGEVYWPFGRAPELGDVIRNQDWADVLKTMVRAEKEAQHKGRTRGIEAARDAFYKGDLAERIARFISVAGSAKWRLAA